jgi:diguanylate cyclase (GGDEF)-like protein
MRPERSTDGRLLVGGVVTDITDRKHAEATMIEAEQLAQTALHDDLTRLPNRTAAQKHLDLALARAEHSGTGVAVLFIDLDDFKLVNDSFGHAAGDELLRAVGARLREAVRREDLVARQGGDEFLVLLADLAQHGRDGRSLSDRADAVARTVRLALREPFVLDGIEVFVSASVGISLHPNDASDATALLQHADVAMYAVKARGRDGHSLYARDCEPGREQMSMASRLHRTLERAEGLVLHYQPLVRLDSGEVVGVEALVRWQDAARGLVAPSDFLPLAERIGLLGALSDWVVEQACRQAAAWLADGRELYVSLNMPPSYCQGHGLSHLVSSARAAGVALEHLMIEITESALVPGGRETMQSDLAAMSGHGLRLAIDDFGTGYSSLGRLNNGWVNTLKIDRSFVHGLPHDAHARKLVSSVVALAQTLELEPLAEGVETEAQRRFLVENGCTFGQGFLFSRPLPVDELELYLDRVAGVRSPLGAI